MSDKFEEPTGEGHTFVVVNFPGGGKDIIHRSPNEVWWWDGERFTWPDLLEQLGVDHIESISILIDPDKAEEIAPSGPQSVHIVVEYANHETRYYPVPTGESWRVDTALRMLIVGHGPGRQMIPLDNVMSFSPQRIEGVTK